MWNWKVLTRKTNKKWRKYQESAKPLKVCHVVWSYCFLLFLFVLFYLKSVSSLRNEKKRKEIVVQTSQRVLKRVCVRKKTHRKRQKSKNNINNKNTKTTLYAGINKLRKRENEHFWRAGIGSIKGERERKKKTNAFGGTQQVWNRKRKIEHFWRE